MSADYTELHAPILPALRELLCRSVWPRAGLVLDLAGGAGAKLALLRAALGPGVRLLNLDIDRAAVASSDAELRLVADAHSLPLRDACLDGAVCIAALGALHNPALALRELRRVLKPGAPLLLVTAATRWAALAEPTASQLAEYQSALQAGGAPRAASEDLDIGLAELLTAGGFANIGLRAFAYELHAEPLAAELALHPTALDEIQPIAILLAAQARSPASS